MASINTPARLGPAFRGEPDWAGTACLPGRAAQFRADTLRALEYARAVGCPMEHVMAGALAPGQDEREARAAFLAALGWAAGEAEGRGLTLLVEPISRSALPGYFVGGVEAAAGLLAELGRPSVRMLLDLFHAQVAGGDVSRLAERHAALVAHVQVAGAPERHEPCDGELRVPYVLARLREAGYGGLVSCEYRPSRGTEAGLERWWYLPGPASR